MCLVPNTYYFLALASDYRPFVGRIIPHLVVPVLLTGAGARDEDVRYDDILRHTFSFIRPVRGLKRRMTHDSSNPLLMERVALVMTIVVVLTGGMLVVDAKPGRGPHFDTSIKEYDNERTCWTGEVCKTEFQAEFRCKCPRWYWCRSPGRYYHAYCTMSALGYIWIQPGGLVPEDALHQ